MKEDEIINRVTSSSLITFDLEELYQHGDRVQIDIKDQLYEGLILKEKDFRAYIKNANWSQYQDKFVAIHCSVDAIIPTWAYMLLAIALRPYAQVTQFGTLEQLEEELYNKALSGINWQQFQNAKIVIKGCSKINVPTSAYFKVVEYLQPIAASLMFGEACSTVPLYKSKAK